MTLYCYPRCSTCKKATQWLDAQGLSYEYVDIKTNPPSAEQLEQYHVQSELPMRRFFNTSGNSYRALGLAGGKLDELSDAKKLELLAADGMLIKRPLLVSDDKVLVGFKVAEWEAALLGEES